LVQSLLDNEGRLSFAEPDMRETVVLAERLVTLAKRLSSLFYSIRSGIVVNLSNDVVPDSTTIEQRRAQLILSIAAANAKIEEAAEIYRALLRVADVENRLVARAGERGTY
jgi:hypothetical protein